MSESVAVPPDPFDPERLRLTQDFAESLGVKKHLLTVPARKPNREEFVRVNPDPAYSLQTAVLELKEEGETYLASQDLWPQLSNEATFGPRLLSTAINRQGVLFLWMMRLPRADGKIDAWSQSALEAAELAKCGWVRVVSNMSLGAYEVFEATGDFPEPNWPTIPFKKILETAFKNHIIESLDHPVLRRLRGEV